MEQLKGPSKQPDAGKSVDGIVVAKFMGGLTKIRDEAASILDRAASQIFNEHSDSLAEQG